MKRLALQLSDEDRGRLAGELTLSVTPEPDAEGPRPEDHPHAGEWRDAVNRRVEEIRSGQVELLDGPAVFAELDRKMKAGTL